MMKDIAPSRPVTSRARLQIIFFAALLTKLIIPAQGLSADQLNECLLDALIRADDSITVGQLREQCRQELGTGQTTKFSQFSPADEKDNVSSTDIKGERIGLTIDSDGPTAIILRTSQAKKPAFFPHKKHQDRYSCGKCHHGKDSSGMLVEYSANTIIKKCTACHNSNLPNKELDGFQLIGHRLCRECHRKNENLTLARCSTCHRKNL